jgi:hypothetical protein
MPKRVPDSQSRSANNMRRQLMMQSRVQTVLSLRWWLLAPAALLSAGLIGGFIVLHFYGATPTAEADLAAIQSKIARHYLLPSDEIPALATVTNKAKLTAPIFKQAQDGDRILIYQNRKLAIIYRPKIDRIIATGPVAIDTPPTKQAQ